MVFSEALFLKFLKTRAGIREGVPDTVLGFSSSGTPQATLKSSLGGGATQLLESLDQSGDSSNLLWTFSQSYLFDNFTKFKLVILGINSGNGEVTVLPNDIATGSSNLSYSLYSTTGGADPIGFISNTTDKIILGDGADLYYLTADFNKVGGSLGTLFVDLKYQRDNTFIAGSQNYNDDSFSGNNTIGTSLSSLRFRVDGGENFKAGTKFRLYGVA